MLIFNGPSSVERTGFLNFQELGQSLISELIGRGFEPIYPQYSGEGFNPGMCILRPRIPFGGNTFTPDTLGNMQPWHLKIDYTGGVSDEEPGYLRISVSNPLQMPPTSTSEIETIFKGAVFEYTTGDKANYYAPDGFFIREVGELTSGWYGTDLKDLSVLPTKIVPLAAFATAKEMPTSLNDYTEAEVNYFDYTDTTLEDTLILNDGMVLSRAVETTTVSEDCDSDPLPPKPSMTMPPVFTTAYPLIKRASMKPLLGPGGLPVIGEGQVSIPFASRFWGETNTTNVIDCTGKTFSYTLTVTNSGIVLVVKEELQEMAGNKFSWFVVQRLVDPVTGVILSTGDSPVICMYSIGGGNPTDVAPANFLVKQKDPFTRKHEEYDKNPGIYYFIVRENDVWKTTTPRLATASSPYGRAVINGKEQVAKLETNRPFIFFPCGFNTQRLYYKEELDLIAYSSADAFPPNSLVKIKKYNESAPRTYKAIAANMPNNRGMVLLVLVSSSSILQSAPVNTPVNIYTPPSYTPPSPPPGSPPGSGK